MKGIQFSWVRKKQRFVGKTVLNGLIFFAFLLLAFSGQGQGCDVGPGNYKTYTQTLNDFSGRTTTITEASKATNFTFPSDNWMLLIPAGINFTGGINGNSYAHTVICIVGSFNPPWVNNFSGIVRNYNTSASITFDRVYPQIENYGGTISYTSNQCGNILNFEGGTVNCSGNLNIGNNYSVYNEGVFTVASELQGEGCIHNEAWITANSYFGNNDVLNNGKIEIISTQMSFNGGAIINNCALFSGASGTSFQNNTSIENNGLIYLPIGSFENKAGRTFTNGETGVVRARNFDNRGNFYGSGWVYVTNTSENYGLFGDGSNRTIHFYDSSPGGNPCSFDIQSGTIRSDVAFSPFPEPSYSPDLSEYQCGDIILSGSISPGEIAASQILCLGIDPAGFTSVSPASCPDAEATIAYQWQSSTDDLFYTNISGAIGETCSVSARPGVYTYYRRRAKATYPPADSVKNSMDYSNVVYLNPVNDYPASITASPSDETLCHGQNTSFSGSAQNHDSYRWQESTDSGNSWADLNNSAPYSGVTTETLSITGATDGMDGYQYRLAALDANCGNVYSDAATLTVIADDTPVIRTQPAHQYVCPDAVSAEFTVEAEDECNYQWQRSTDNGTNWSDLSSGTDYSNVTTATLTVNSGGLTNGDQFRCILSAACDDIASNAAILYQVTPEIGVTPITIIKCPDADPTLDFNSLNHEYDMGMSAISFTIERETEGSFPWSFDYEITADPALLAAEQPQSTSGSISSPAGTTSLELTFYLENQTEEMVEARFRLQMQAWPVVSKPPRRSTVQRFTFGECRFRGCLPLIRQIPENESTL